MSDIQTNFWKFLQYLKHVGSEIKRNGKEKGRNRDKMKGRKELREKENIKFDENKHNFRDKMI